MSYTDPAVVYDTVVVDKLRATIAHHLSLQDIRLLDTRVESYLDALGQQMALTMAGHVLQGGTRVERVPYRHVCRRITVQWTRTKHFIWWFTEGPSTRLGRKVRKWAQVRFMPEFEEWHVTHKGTVDYEVKDRICPHGKIDSPQAHIEFLVRRGTDAL